MPVADSSPRIEPVSRPRPDVALHEYRVALEVRFGRRLDLGGGERDLDALVVDVTIPGETHDHQLARAVQVRQGEHDVLEGVRGGPLPLGGRSEVRVRVVDESLDRRCVRRVEDDGSGSPSNGIGVGRRRW